MEKLIDKRGALISFFLILLTVGIYWRVSGHDFINYDDPVYITENPNVKAGFSGESIRWAFTSGYAGNWHPLTWLSHTLDYQLFGSNAGAHHLMNLFLHTVNAVLLFLFFRMATGALWPSAFVAALFALHPLHVESVAWAAERKDILSALFWILTMIAYVRYVRQPGSKRHALVLLFFVLGLMAKPMLVTLPFVLLLLDYWPLGRFGNTYSMEAGKPKIHRRKFPTDQNSDLLRVAREKLPLFLLAAISSVVTFIVQQSGGAVGSWVTLPLNTRIANALVSYVSYIGKMIWPDNLALFYPYPKSFPTWEIALALLVVVGITALVLLKRQRYPFLLVGWLWYVGTLVPVIGLVQVGDQAMADRYTYVTLIGLFIVVAWSVPHVLANWPQRKIGLSLIGGAAIATCLPLTWQQLRYWKDSFTLYEHSIRVTSENYLAHNNLGAAWHQHGRKDEALKHFSESVRIKPDYADGHNNLGSVLAEQGNFTEAIRHFSTALELKRDFDLARGNLQRAQTSLRGKADATASYSEKVKLNPQDENAHYSLGRLLIEAGNIEDASAHLAEAVKLKPDFVDARKSFAELLAKQGKTLEAITQYSLALQTKPNDPELRNGHGVALGREGKLPEAIAELSEALRIKPDYAEAHNNLGITLAMKGATKEAISRFAEALRLDPQLASAHHNLGLLLVQEGKLEEAIEHFSAVLKIQPDNRDARAALDNARKLLSERGLK